MQNTKKEITVGSGKVNLTAADEARFWAKVDKDGPLIQHMDTRCHSWAAFRNKFGYGILLVSKKPILAHRIAATIANGPIPIGFCACHKCDNPSCVNPDHLFLGTQADNNRDRDEKGRQVARCGDFHGSKTKPERIPRGENHHQGKMTNQKVIKMRQKYASGGITQMALSKEFGVAQSLVGRIVLNQIWNHI